MTCSIPIFKSGLVSVFFVMTALSAAADNGKAWGGKCIITHSGGNITTSSCSSEGTTCADNGWGGGDCSTSIAAKPIINGTGAIRGTTAPSAVKNDAARTSGQVLSK